MDVVSINQASGEAGVFGDLIAQYAQEPLEWTEPTHFDASSWSDRREVSRRIENGRISTTIDRIDSIADDLFEMRHPDQKADTLARNDFTDAIKSRGVGYGNWIAFDWNKSLVRYPNQHDHRDLRTFRNKLLITEAEQSKLFDARVAVFGMSVGSNVVEQLMLGGIGGALATGDFDTLSPSNLNRIKASMGQVGMRKLDIVACKTSEVDPYVDQVHLHNGVTRQSLSQLAEFHPTIIYDEIDDLAAKALLRQFAADYKIPLVMATDVGDTSIIDVERYDLGTATPFNGRLNKRQVDSLLSGSVSALECQGMTQAVTGTERHNSETKASLVDLSDEWETSRIVADDMSPSERQKLMIKVVGLRHLTPRLIESAMATNVTLGGLPQLGTTASMGGALAAVTAREIILGRKMESGRYVSSPKKTLQLAHQESVSSGIDTLIRFAKHRPR